MSDIPTDQNPITGALLRRKIRLEQSKRGKKSGSFTKYHTFLSHGDPECPEIRQPPMIEPKDIKELRKKFDMKVKEFGRLIGVHGDTIKKYEAGLRIPSYATLRVMQLLRTNSQFTKVLPATAYFNQDKIYLTRSHLNVSQSVFARILGVETSTLRGWEISKRKPSGPSVTLLQLAYCFPSQFVTAIIQNEAQAIDPSESIEDVDVFSGEVQTQHVKPENTKTSHQAIDPSKSIDDIEITSTEVQTQHIKPENTKTSHQAIDPSKSIDDIEITSTEVQTQHIKPENTKTSHQAIDSSKSIDDIEITSTEVQTQHIKPEKTETSHPATDQTTFGF